MNIDNAYGDGDEKKWGSMDNDFDLIRACTYLKISDADISFVLNAFFTLGKDNRWRHSELEEQYQKWYLKKYIPWHMDTNGGRDDND